MSLDRTAGILAAVALCLTLAVTLTYAKGKPAGGADNKAPDSIITDPVSGAVIPTALWAYSIKGKASDGRRGSGVQYVEVSTDGGSNWSRARDVSADGSWAAWSFRWPLDFAGEYTLTCRATDRSGNVEIPKKGVTVTVTH